MVKITIVNKKQIENPLQRQVGVDYEDRLRLQFHTKSISKNANPAFMLINNNFTKFKPALINTPDYRIITTNKGIFTKYLNQIYYLLPKIKEGISNILPVVQEPTICPMKMNIYISNQKNFVFKPEIVELKDTTYHLIVQISGDKEYYSNEKDSEHVKIKEENSIFVRVRGSNSCNNSDTLIYLLELKNAEYSNNNQNMKIEILKSRNFEIQDICNLQPKFRNR
ncbi:hypothetical protein U3516DRAFT_749573 [Neocallimastix sp. 'constans']